MITMAESARGVTGGVDTHKDSHVGAALDEVGRVLGTEVFPATAAGYRRLLRWLCGFGEVVAVGVEGTGSWGAGLARYLAAENVSVIEVTRPNRQHRRRHGKSDPADAIGAARAVLAGEATGTPKSQNGAVESIRLLRVARRSAVKARTQVANQLHAVIDTAPAELRQRLDSVNTDQIVTLVARFHRRAPLTPHDAARLTLRILARRYQQLDAEIAELDTHLDQLTAEAAPTLRRDQRGRPPQRRHHARRGRRQPAPAAFSRLVRRALRHLSDRRLFRTSAAPSPQPRRRPPSQQRPLHHRDVPTPLAPANQELHGSTTGRGTDQERGDSLPQALRRHRSPPRHHPRPPHPNPTPPNRCLTSIEASGRWRVIPLGGVRHGG